MTRAHAQNVLAVPVLAVVVGCASAPALVGPGVPGGAEIARIDIEPLDPAYGSRAVVEDHATIGGALPLFAEAGWQADEGMPLAPHFKVTLHGNDGRAFSYFVGTFSDPPRAPCFWFCTGYWLAGASPDGKPNSDKYRALATSGDLDRVARLLKYTDVNAR